MNAFERANPLCVHAAFLSYAWVQFCKFKPAKLGTRPPLAVLAGQCYHSPSLWAVYGVRRTRCDDTVPVTCAKDLHNKLQLQSDTKLILC